MMVVVSAPPETMHAVHLVGHGGLDKLVYRTDVPVPRPAPDELLVEVRAAGVNNTDINTRIGWYSEQIRGATDDAVATPLGDAADGSWTGAPLGFPRIQGADVCGIVVAVGPGVARSRLGERVIVQGCLRSLGSGGTAPWLGSERDGGFAQFVCVPAADTYAVVTELSDEQLAAVPCAYATAENLLHRSGVREGERVLVTGASGGVGSAAVMLARIRGAEVIALAGRGKEDAVRSLGAARVLSREASLLAELGQGQIDTVIDLVGGPRWRELVHLLRPGGRYAAAGAIAGPIVELDLRALYLNDLTLYGCTMQAAEVFPRLVSLLERGDLVPLVSAVYPLDRIARAQQDFESKQHIGKLVLLPPAPRQDARSATGAPQLSHSPLQLEVQVDILRVELNGDRGPGQGEAILICLRGLVDRRIDLVVLGRELVERCPGLGVAGVLGEAPRSAIGAAIRPRR
jgi:NADPH:quinone reductase-like Zn-dependent oxidoreductase